jgi:hypothetical protein
MPIKLPKTQGNEGATSKYPEYTDTKILVTFLKFLWHLGQVMFFFGNRTLIKQVHTRASMLHMLQLIIFGAQIICSSEFP